MIVSNRISCLRMH